MMVALLRGFWGYFDGLHAADQQALKKPWRLSSLVMVQIRVKHASTIFVSCEYLI